MKKISFCITTKNRFHQISETLPINLEANKTHKDSVEFVLADFNDDDILQKWLVSNFSEALEEGYLKYVHTNEMSAWHGPIAKNTSHYYATGEYLVNLDGDNYTGSNGGHYVYTLFQDYGAELLLHHYGGDWFYGNYGRIGMHRKYFHMVGGYDESFESMLHEDMDLINRLSELGLNYKRVGVGNSPYNLAIHNPRDESIKYSESKLSWYAMEAKNAKQAKANLMSGILTANNGNFGIKKNIYTYKNGEIVPC